MGFANPFGKASANAYQGVLVPLAQAKRHATVVAEYERRKSLEGREVSDVDVDAEVKGEKVEKAPVDSGESGVGSTTSRAYSPYTVEGLRAEVYEGIDGVELSTYECMYYFFWFGVEGGREVEI